MILSDWRRISARPAAALLLTATVPMTALAETRPTLNLYGVTGLIDMPSAEAQPDGDFSINMSRFGPTMRTTLTFQISPRLQGSFRYTGVRGLTLAGFGPNQTYYDRSFDIRYRLLDEGLWWPAVTIGLQDFVGTGLFSGEYVVATKHMSPRVKVTAGLGWGRLGSYGSFANLGTRPAPGTKTGGTPNIKQWFRGPIAPFGGIEWQVSDKLGLKFEYSSDAYSEEAVKQGLFKRRSPINIGAEYQLTEGVRLGAYYLYGSTIGFSANIALNPKRRAIAGISGPAPAPVVLRPSRQSNPAAWSDSWANAGGTAAATSLSGKVANQLQAEGVVLESLAVTGSHVEVRISNRLYDANAQAIGRTARALTATMPASVETFDIVPVERGMDMARVRVRRSAGPTSNRWNISRTMPPRCASGSNSRMPRPSRPAMCPARTGSARSAGGWLPICAMACSTRQARCAPMSACGFRQNCALPVASICRGRSPSALPATSANTTRRPTRSCRMSGRTTICATAATTSWNG